MRLAVFQFNVIWEDISGNQKLIEQFLDGRKELPELLILPEMYATGFTINPKNILVEHIDGQLTWQKKISERYGIAIMGSTIVREGEKYRNRLLFTSPSGESHQYDKRHLFQMESNLFDCGTERTLIEFNGVKIMPQICYDLRFPVWSRNDFGYHLLIYVANWPSSRMLVWDTLLRARAIENQCICVGVNRTGIDGNNIEYNGGSAVYDPKGETLIYLGEGDNYGAVNVNIQEMVKFREKFGAYKDSDQFEIKP